MMLLVIISSFYAIESLRNQFLNILLHLTGLFIALHLAIREYGISIQGFGFTLETLLLLASPIFCRALVSAIEERDVILREIIKRKDIYVPIEDPETTRKMNFFKVKSQTWMDKAKKAEAEKEELLRQFSRIRNEQEKNNEERTQMNMEIAKAYFSLLANIRFDLSKGVDENVDRTLRAFMAITKSQYVALIVKEPPAEPNLEYSLALTNSYQSPDVCVDDEKFLQSEKVWKEIISSLENDKSRFLVLEDMGNIRNAIFTPVSYHPDVKGVLVQGFDTGYKENIHNFNLSLMAAYHIYSVLKNEHLYRQAKDESNTDALTGVFNKKYLIDNLQIIFNNAASYAENLACIFIDADWFKQVNDSKGHDEGDRILKLIASSLKQNTRKSDFVFRYGGDEFVVLLNNATKEKITSLSETVNKELMENGCKAVVNGTERFVTVSMGAKIFNPMEENETASGEMLLKEADDALYEAKSQGKGKVCIRF